MTVTDSDWGGRIDADVIELGELLDRVVAFVRRYVVVGDDELTILALFVAHTWVSDAAEATPYIVVGSAEKASGKTKLLEVLALLCWMAWHTASVSESALFRTIEAECPTLLLDETDALFKSHSERTEPIRAVLNSGNKKRATIPRCVPPKFEVRKFKTYCPKVLAGITTERLPETIRDRAVTIKMRRRHPGEHVDRFYYRHAEAASTDLKSDLERWSKSAIEKLREVEPDLPAELQDRMADALEPLFAIADAAGGRWPKQARDSAIALTKVEADDELGRGAQVLASMQKAMGRADTIHTESLLKAINDDEELPFGGWSEGKGIDARGLAKLLRPYEIRSKTVRVGQESKKGYHRDDLADAWSRYLPPSPTEGSQGSQGSHSGEGVTKKPHGQADVTHVTDVTPIDGMEGSDGTNGVGELTEAEYVERFRRRMGQEP